MRTIVLAVLATAAAAAFCGGAQAATYGYGQSYAQDQGGYAGDAYAYGRRYDEEAGAYRQPDCSTVTRRVYDDYGCEQYVQARVCR